MSFLAADAEPHTMGSKQSSFLEEFKEAYRKHFGPSAIWTGGQSAANTAGFIASTGGRRPTGQKSGERFELGDATTKRHQWTFIVEFESKEVPLSNLLKYWPYIRGELNARPAGPIALCHFSSWWSYATRRDLWEWTLSRMQVDPDRLVDIHGRQFDHWDDDQSRRSETLSAAIQWLDRVVNSGEAARSDAGRI